MKVLQPQLVLTFLLISEQFSGSYSYTRFLFYKEPTSRPSSKIFLFVDLKSSNYNTKSSLIAPLISLHIKCHKYSMETGKKVPEAHARQHMQKLLNKAIDARNSKQSMRVLAVNEPAF